jgi:hypothetical protein
MKIRLNNNLKLTFQIGTLINIALYIFDKYAIVPAWVIFPFLQNRIFSWCRDKKSIIGCRLERNGWIVVFVFIYLAVFMIVYIISKIKSRPVE